MEHRDAPSGAFCWHGRRCSRWTSQRGSAVCSRAGRRRCAHAPWSPAAFGAAPRLRAADLLILSENWYDTAFANELNGPLVHDALRLIKTTPEAVSFHRSAIAGEHPFLEPVATLRPPTFMPELLLHRRVYGSFTQFVGDIVILRPRPAHP